MTVVLISVGHPAVATIARPSGGGMDQNGVTSSGVFGLSGTSVYFDTTGATIGQGASLGYDGSIGKFFVAAGTANYLPYLMFLRQAARERYVSMQVDLVPQRHRQQARVASTLLLHSGAERVREQARRETPGITVIDGSGARARNKAWRRPSDFTPDHSQVDTTCAALARNRAWRRRPAAWAEMS